MDMIRMEKCDNWGQAPTKFISPEMTNNKWLGTIRNISKNHKDTPLLKLKFTKGLNWKFNPTNCTVTSKTFSFHGSKVRSKPKLLKKLRKLSEKNISLKDKVVEAKGKGRTTLLKVLKSMKKKCGKLRS